MVNSLKGVFMKVLKNEENEEELVNLSYSKIPLTVALCKRKFEEEQRTKYGITKDKVCDID